MTTGTLQIIKNGALAFGVSVSLVAGSLSLPGNAEARVPAGPRQTEQAQVCGWIQDRFDEALHEWVHGPINGPQEEENWEAVEDTMEGWKDQGCDDDYGSIGARPVRITNLTNLGPIRGTSR
jgi:hypothetical protein